MASILLAEATATDHLLRCGSDNVEEIDNNVFECQDCGATYFEQMFTSCAHCGEMTMPIDDWGFDGTCSSCGQEGLS